MKKNGLYIALFGLLMVLLFVLSLLYEMHIIIAVVEVLAFIAFYVLRDKPKELGIAALTVIASTAAAFGIRHFIFP